MKLVYEIFWDEPYVASGTHTLCFEYSSIEDFQLMVLQKIEDYKSEYIKLNGKRDGKRYYRFCQIELFGKYFDIGDLEDSIESSVHPLEGWFEKNKS